MQSINEKSPMNIDQHKLFNELDTSIEKVKNFSNKDFVLVIGNTGAGKSTTINYLLGHKLEKTVDDFGFECLDVKSGVKNPFAPNHAKIGHDMSISQTRFPELFDNQKNVQFCDCPGFNENRSTEQEITVPITIKMAISRARSIKSVVVVLEDPSYSDKGEDLKNVFTMIRNLFSQNPDSGQPTMTIEELQQSIVFVATKTQLEGATYEFLKNMADQSQAEESETSRIIEQVVSLVRPDGSNFIEVNPLDDGQSREQIIAQINHCKPLHPNQFGFPLDSSTKFALDELFQQFTDQLLPIYRDLRSLDSELRMVKQQKLSNLTRREQLIAHIQQLEQIDTNASQECQATFITIIQQLEKQRHDLMSEQVALKLSLKELKTLIDELSSDEPVLHWQDIKHDRSTFGKAYGRLMHAYKIEYRGIPFTSVRSEHVNGHFKQSSYRIDKMKGEFNVTFVSSMCATGYAKVTVFVPKCSIPENKKQRHAYKKNFAKQNQRLKVVTSEISSNEKNSLHFKKELGKLQSMSIQKAQEEKNQFIFVIHSELTAIDEQLLCHNQKIFKTEQLINILDLQSVELSKELKLLRLLTPLLSQKPSPLVSECLQLSEMHQASKQQDKFVNNPNATFFSIPVRRPFVMMGGIQLEETQAPTAPPLDLIE